MTETTTAPSSGAAFATGKSSTSTRGSSLAVLADDADGTEGADAGTFGFAGTGEAVGALESVAAGGFATVTAGGSSALAERYEVEDVSPDDGSATADVTISASAALRQTPNSIVLR